MRGEGPTYKWKTYIKKITEDRGGTDGDLEKRLLWKLETVSNTMTG
jgi:hypothetical protein